MTAQDNSIALFHEKQVRRHWDEDKELWYFSVVDVVQVLTNSVDAGAYWRKLKQRLKEEGSEVVTKCHELKFMVFSAEKKNKLKNEGNEVYEKIVQLAK